MALRDEEPLPDVAEVLGRVLARVAAPEQPLLVAIAERWAADRYRRWASEVGDGARRAELLACAAREEEIAGRIEALYPEAAATQRDVLAKNSDLPDVNRDLFAGRPPAQQYAIQARGERLGAATWRALAAREEREEARRTFLSCAELEERSAVVLEGILAEGS
jgi:hypothetical protein